MKRALLIGSGLLLSGLVGLVLVLLFRTTTLTSRQISAEPVPVPPASDEAVQNLAGALRFRTQSSQDGSIDPEPFIAFRSYLSERYPSFYRSLEIELLEQHSILATWRGSQPDLPALVMLAHQDVVPIADPQSWTQQPFAGTVAGGFVWGRGAIDDKGSLIAIHQAVSSLISKGFRPKRTMHFVFSHDEELGGSGARAASAWLTRNHVKVEAIYDEGLIIADGLVPGVPGKLALIGVTERGYVTLEVVASGKAGHASMPPPREEGTVAVLASAIRKLQDNPLPGSLEGPADEMFDWVAPEMSGVNRVVFANRWLLSSVIVNQMKNKASTNASLRTTFAPTMLRASPQENVMPSEAIASLNFRLHPRDTIEGMRSWAEATIADPRVKVRVSKPGNEPSKTASTDSRAFLALQTSFAEVFPGMPVAPGLFIAATDSRWLQSHTDDIYRFQPVPTTAEDLGRIHGVDERISIQDFGNMIVLYERLLQHGTE